MTYNDNELDKRAGQVPDETAADPQIAADIAETGVTEVKRGPGRPIGVKRGPGRPTAAERNADKQRAWYYRNKVAIAVWERSKDRQKFWADNRASLDPTVLQDLEHRQSEFLRLWAQVMEVIENLKTGVKIGPQLDGSFDLPFCDVLFEQVHSYIALTNPTGRLVWHPSQEEFTELYHPDNKKSLEMFRSADLNWFEFGLYTNFQEGVWRDFIRVVANYISENPNDDNFDPEISKQIVAEHYRLHPHLKRAQSRHVNQTDESAQAATQAAKLRLLSESSHKRMEELNQKERIKLLSEPNRIL